MHLCISEIELSFVPFNIAGAWIITGGNYCGVMKHVGKAVRDYGVDSNVPPVTLIGIAPWGKVNNRDALIIPPVLPIFFNLICKLTAFASY